jgi:hypothetical protein
LTYNTLTYSSFPTVWTYLNLGVLSLLLALHWSVCYSGSPVLLVLPCILSFLASVLIFS